MFYPETSLYGIRVVGADYMKVGLSQEPLRRMKQFQESMPFELALVFSVLISEGKGARAFEKRVHDRLREYCFYREWFKVSVPMCIQVVESELGIVFERGGLVCSEAPLSVPLASPELPLKR